MPPIYGQLAPGQLSSVLAATGAVGPLSLE
jgi:hypothetical protein